MSKEQVIVILESKGFSLSNLDKECIAKDNCKINQAPILLGGIRY